MYKLDIYGWRQKQKQKQNNNKSILGATLAPSSSWPELQAGAKIDQKFGVQRIYP